MLEVPNCGERSKRFEIHALSRKLITDYSIASQKRKGASTLGHNVPNQAKLYAVYRGPSKITPTFPHITTFENVSPSSLNTRRTYLRKVAVKETQKMLYLWPFLECNYDLPTCMTYMLKLEA